ncbi:MAG TPA: hypothetical protein ENG87_05135 [Candidatus Pacearchaeota archaeon]|nr:hypothetical protein [Candidatus Pacearchaeota archaeon]
MVDSVIFSWGLGIIGAILGIVGGVCFLIRLSMMRGEIKKSLFFLFISNFIWIVYSIIMILLFFKKLDITNTIWIIIPLLYTLTSVFFIIGTLKLMNTIKSIQKVNIKKLRV